MKTKHVWNKFPSVTREGKYFYRSGCCTVTVLQSFLTGNWNVVKNGQPGDGEFKTAKEAMDAAF
jgi:hypothetical protein